MSVFPHVAIKKKKKPRKQKHGRQRDLKNNSEHNRDCFNAASSSPPKQINSSQASLFSFAANVSIEISRRGLTLDATFHT